LCPPGARSRARIDHLHKIVMLAAPIVTGP
jgi:hypothetical protein